MKLVGLDNQLKSISNMIKISKKIHNLRIKIPSSLKLSILLTGEPGTGKTASIKQVAEENGMKIEIVKFSDVVQGVLGESLHRLTKVFDDAKKESQKSPIILFFDEIDAIGKERSDDSEVGEMKRLVITFLQNIDEMDYEKTPVIIVGATNHPKIIDSALFRRFMLKLDYGKPSRDVVKEFFKNFAEFYSGENLVINFDRDLDGVLDKFKDNSIAEIENALNNKIIEKLASDEVVSTLSCGDFIDVKEDFTEQIKAKRTERITRQQKELDDREALKKEIENIDNEINELDKSRDKLIGEENSIKMSLGFNNQRISNLESSIEDEMKLLKIKKDKLDDMKSQNSMAKSKLFQGKIDVIAKEYNERYSKIEPTLKEIERRKKELIELENKMDEISKKYDKIKELEKKKESIKKNWNDLYDKK